MSSWDSVVVWLEVEVVTSLEIFSTMAAMEASRVGIGFVVGKKELVVSGMGGMTEDEENESTNETPIKWAKLQEIQKKRRETIIWSNFFILLQSKVQLNKIRITTFAKNKASCMQ